MTLSEADRAAIERFIAERGITKCPPGASATFSHHPFGRRGRWLLGKHLTPRHRYNLAKIYAVRNGLPEPAWTDLKEETLLRLRKERKSYRQIAHIMGKTKASIQARVRYLALGRRLVGKTRAGIAATPSNETADA